MYLVEAELHSIVDSLPKTMGLANTQFIERWIVRTLFTNTKNATISQTTGDKVVCDLLLPIDSLFWMGRGNFRLIENLIKTVIK